MSQPGQPGRRNAGRLFLPLRPYKRPQQRKIGETEVLGPGWGSSVMSRRGRHTKYT